MPRTTEKPYTRVLTYFKTAPMAEIGIVLDMVKAEVKGREAAAHRPGPKPAPIALASPAVATPAKKKPGPKPKAKMAAAVAAPAKAKKKPGPKPGSKRKQTTVNTPPAASADDNPDLLDRIEAIQEVIPGELPPQTAEDLD